MKKMCIWLLIFLAYWNSAYSKEETKNLDQIEVCLSAECEPISTIAGCVNIESGRFFQIDEDLISNTICPLSLRRYYDSQSRSESLFGSGFGSQFPLMISEMQKGSRHSYVLISQRDGFLIPYRSDHDRNPFNLICTFRIDPRLLEKGYTNVGGGHSNFMNWKAFYEPTCSPRGTSWTILLGDGTRRIYKLLASISLENRLEMDFPTPIVYLLTEEILPNGNRLKFEYQMVEGKPYLSKVHMRNRDESAVLNALHFSYSADGCEVKSSCGRHASYMQKTGRCKLLQFNRLIKFKKRLLKQANSSQNGIITYTTDHQAHQLSQVTRVEKSQGRFLEVKYNQDQKVKALYEPLGANGEKVATYQFDYQKQFTHVWDALEQLTVYHFNPSHRLDRIDYRDGSQLVRQEAFYWSKRSGQEGWLKAKSVKLEDALFTLQSYNYDEKGNIISEITYGNLTGEKPQSFALNAMRKTDRYRIDYYYSDDDFNLLIEKSTPEGLKIAYAYLPGTNLRTKELISYEGKIQERTFQFYDENGQLKTIIEDDGSAQEEGDLTHVTYRRIKTIEAAADPQHPSFGKPKTIVESYRDQATGNIVPLKTIQCSYDSRGYETSQQIYDSKGAFCYETTKAYDGRGRLVKESNALGHVTRYAYDDNHNKTEEELLGSGKKIFYFYDLGNRLIRKEETHQKEKVFTTTYTYNSLSQLIAEQDAYGHETTYHYDRLGRQIQCIKPAIQTIEGAIERPAIKREYNLLNQCIAETNENGFTTRYTYNVYGKPIQIEYPDQGVERSIYYPSGWLKQKWHPDGSSVSYTYDAKGRPLKETSFETDGTILKEEEYGYKGALLVYKKDHTGLVTSYAYDGAGRKIEERIGAKKIQYVYDDFGRQVKIFRALNPEEGQWEIYEYDALDRPLLKTLQDSSGQLYAKESYAYDIQGNLNFKRVWQSDDRIAHYKSLYNSEGRLFYRKNPLGHRSTRKYHHHHINDLGQRVLAIEIKDPLGRLSLEVEDALHRLAKREDDLEGRRVSSCSYTYDAAGNVTKQDISVMQDDSLLRNYSIVYSYNHCGDLLSETEMPEGKTVRYAYDQRRRLVRKEKPDGTWLHYQYDALGRLKALHSSDGKVNYSYTYDGHGNPIEIHDHIHQTVQKRSYDLYDRLMQEELMPGIVMKYQYDALDRLIEALLPDSSSIRYVYDAFHLRQVQRYNTEGELQYNYECERYNLRGDLLVGISPVGSTAYEYDLLRRATAIKAARWSSFLEEIDPVGNVLAQVHVDPDGKRHETFGYDRFNYLKREPSHEYVYDSIGNCLKRDHEELEINALNQLTKEGLCQYSYDANGNLIHQTHPLASYKYDALDRLVCIQREGKQTELFYDAFGRCLQIKEEGTVKQLLYFRDREIGSLMEGKLQELKVVHPNNQSEAVFAVECKGQTLFPIQDFRYNICALQRPDGTLAQWHHYSAFGQKERHGEEGICSPWLFANRREVEGLLLFAHRFYSPQLRRWMTTDPLRFKSGINLYTYNRNNPFSYIDPDGRCPLLIMFPLIEIGFGAIGMTISATTINTILVSTGVALIGWSAYELDKRLDHRYYQEQHEEAKKPRFDGKELGNDSTKCPGEGFEWKGRGEVGSKQGSWYNESTDEKLYPDLNHPSPQGPHWDYESPDYPEGVRLYPNGTWEKK